MNIERNLEFLHPLARPAFETLAERLKNETVFRAFETYRSPLRQEILYPTGSTRARAWRSPHQYGLAVDFVPWVNGAWTWDADSPWQQLREYATAAGLLCELDWDRAHVEHPAWKGDFSRWMKKVK